MSDPSAKTHTNESRRTISVVESLRAEIAQLRTERDKLIKAIEDLDAVYVRVNTHSRICDTDIPWHMANARNIAQEANHE